MKLLKGLIVLGLLQTASLGQANEVAKTRYLVMFKSAEGYRAMENVVSQKEAAQSYGFKKSLRNIRTMIIEASSPAVIERLSHHPEVAFIEAEQITPMIKPVYGSQKISRSHLKVLENLKPVTDLQTTTLSFQEGPQTPWGIKAVKAPEAWALSDGGAHARVAVLDTGIDKDHQDLKANFEEGQNFFLSPDTPTEADFADDEGHGTHCSGTIGAVYNTATGFTGVAPKVKLLMGRVCGTFVPAKPPANGQPGEPAIQGCNNISVAQGIDWAISKKVDVISMSLGGPTPTARQQAAIALAESSGVIVVAASGNGAGEKDYTPACKSPTNHTNCGVSFPGATANVISVGAIDEALNKTNFSQWGPELVITAPGASVLSTVPRGTGRESLVEVSIAGVKTKLNSKAFAGTQVFTVPQVGELVPAGLGKPDDFKTVNVAGKYAFIQRGEIPFTEKVKNAMAAKAVGVVLYNNAAGLVQGMASPDGSILNIPVVMIEKVEGEKLLALLQQGQSVSAEISTIITDYSQYDGTSMATPHVAGVIALMRSTNKKMTPAQARMILRTTALVRTPNDTNQYGAGVIQADKAVEAASKLP